MEIRSDLRDAHNASLLHIASPGPVFDAAKRVRIAAVARDAFLTADPVPPWDSPFAEPECTLAYRLARHAGTITATWFHGLGLDPLAAVEVVGIVVAVVPVTGFARALGMEQPQLLAPQPGAPTKLFANELCSATLNWVPVAAPADTRAAVLQALSALPSEDTNLWRLAAAQYMSDAQMADPLFTRGTLSRAQMELVAGRISKLRECFY
jgi:hypothetical protein